MTKEEKEEKMKAYRVFIENLTKEQICREWDSVVNELKEKVKHSKVEKVKRTVENPRTSGGVRFV